MALETGTTVDAAIHRQLAVELFNFVWTLCDKKDRTAEEDEQMVHAAHASRYHWSADGTAKEWSIGEWQISRVYSVLNRAEPAIHHGKLALDWARNSNAAPFFIACRGGGWF